MGKKKKIREDFEAIFQTGNEQAIKEYLEEYPWLLGEVSSVMNDTMLEQHQIIAAIGVMEDELGGAVSFNEIIRSLKEDFNIRKMEGEIQRILKDAENLRLIEKESNGWVLTNEGGRICDVYLNKNLEDLEL
jgi:ribosomal protein S19E (S16A)